MVRVRVLCFATLLALAVTAPAQFGDRIRPPRIDVDLPGIEDLLFKKESPLSTSLKDVTTEGWPVFDGYDPVEVKDLKSAPLDDRGRFVLTPGVWKGTIDSFCGRSASYGPQRGLGYLLGPWKGPKAALIETILRRYSQNKNVSQQDTQLLIWAIIARAKPQSWQGGARTAALALLTQREMSDLGRDVVDFLSDEVMERVMRRADAALRPVYQAENQVRRAVSQANAPFGDLERLMVTEPKEALASSIPRGRWVWARGGTLMRMIPNSYKKTELTIIVPEPARLVRDAQKRVVRLEYPIGTGFEMEYDDSRPAQTFSGDPGLKVHFYKAVIAFRGTERVRIERPGYVFTGRPTREPKPSESNAFANLYATLYPQDGADFIIGSDGRLRRAYDVYRSGRDAADMVDRPRSELDRATREASMDDLLDTGHYRDGVETAVLGSEGDRRDWIVDTLRRMMEALIAATNLLNNLPDGSEGGSGNGGGSGAFGSPGGGGGGSRWADPSGGPYMPGNPGAQRILGSGR